MIVDVPGIPLRTRGGIVYCAVDAEDFVLLNTYRWYLVGAGYAMRRDHGRQVYMHRQLMGLEAGDSREVDHRNGDKLDNRRANLRVGTHAENCQNHPGYRRSSEHRGVSWDKRRGKWRVQFKIAGRLRFLGYHLTEDDAAAVARAFLAERDLVRGAA